MQELSKIKKVDVDRDIKLQDRLTALGILGGYRHLLTCDSTNNVLKKLSQNIILRKQQSNHSIVTPPFINVTHGETSGEPLDQKFEPGELPYVITADEQTAGRGRQSSTWWTGQEALAFSMLLDAKQYGLKPQTSVQLSLGIGFAAMQALRTLTVEAMGETQNNANRSAIPMPNIEIRWPNDVYVNNRKISGILIESANAHHFVIGIGVNTNNSAADSPEEIRDRIVTLRDVLGQKIEQDRLIFLLCREIMRILNYFPLRFPQLIAKIEANLHQLGKIVNISRENDQIVGKCLGMNPDGSLRVLTETNEKAVISGVAL